MIFNKKKKTLSLLLISLNAVFILLSSFGQTFLNKESIYESFAQVISNRAKENKNKELIFSYNIDSANYSLNVENYISLIEEKDNLIQKSSFITTKNDNNSINFRSKNYDFALIQTNRLATIKSKENYFKLISDEFWLYNQPSLITHATIKKGVIISEALANQFIEANSLSNYDDIYGEIFEIQYKNINGLIENENLYIKGILVDGEGKMPLLSGYYGENIILAYNEHLFLHDSHIHFYFSSSINKNLYNIKKLNYWIEKSTPLNAQYNTPVDEKILKEKDLFLNKLSAFNSKLIYVFSLVLFVLLAIGVFTIIALYFFNNNSMYYFLYSIGIFVSNGLIAFVISFQKLKVNWLIFNNSAKGIIVVMYVVLLLVFSIFSKFKKQKNVCKI